MSFLLKSLRVFPSVCLVCIFLNFYVKAVADQAVLTAIEENITEILKEKAGLNPQTKLLFHYPDNTSENQKIEFLRKLQNCLYKIKHLNSIPRLREIYFTGETGETGFDYISSLMTLKLSNQAFTYPWVGVLSWNPTDEDAPEFILHQPTLRVDKLRYTPVFEKITESAETQISNLSFRPYSSSYLPLRSGEILLKPHENRFEKFLKPKINANFKSKSPLERFDDIRQYQLGASSSIITDELKKKIHKPNAELWEGHCNQWSAGSLDLQVNSFIQSTQGIICKNILISQGELKELFTLFYSDYIPNFIAGDRERSLSTKNDHWLRNELGFDDLSADSFHTQLHRYLKRNKGLVMEISSNPEVWNQPVFRAQSRAINVILTGARHSTHLS